MLVCTCTSMQAQQCDQQAFNECIQEADSMFAHSNKKNDDFGSINELEQRHRAVFLYRQAGILCEMRKQEAMAKIAPIFDLQAKINLDYYLSYRSIYYLFDAEGAFYFIDESKKMIEKYGKWDYVEDIQGFLTMKKEGKSYLIRENKIVEVAMHLDEITPNITFAFLSSHYMKPFYNLIGADEEKMPKRIFANTQLKNFYMHPQRINNDVLGFGNMFRFTYVSAEIGNLRNLEELGIFGQTITTLPKEIENLQRLETLFINNTTIMYGGQITVMQVPVEIGKLKNLKVLDFSSTRLASLPKEIGNLTNLENLYLSSCSLNTLPAEIGNLANLEELSLSNNPDIIIIPVEIGKLKKLKYLHLGNCGNIQVLPTQIENLSNLQKLYLSSCNLASLSKEIGNLVNLEYFGLRYNRNLSSLPKEIGKLKKLKYLSLEGCEKLTTLPKEIGNLTNLSDLILPSTINENEVNALRKMLPKCNIKFTPSNKN